MDFYCPQSVDEDFAKLVRKHNSEDLILKDILIKSPSPEKSVAKQSPEKPPIAEKPQNLSPLDKINVEISSLRDTIEQMLASRYVTRYMLL